MSGSIDYQKLPESLRAGVQRYIEHGIAPGGFLTAVIRNDLRDAIGRADDTLLPLLPEIVRWFHWEAPGLCWGSRENMHGWMASHRRAKERKEERIGR